MEGFEWKTDKGNLCFTSSFWLPCGGHIEGDGEWEQEDSEEAITVVQVAGSLDGWSDPPSVGKKWIEIGNVLEVEPRELANGLDGGRNERDIGCDVEALTWATGLFGLWKWWMLDLEPRFGMGQRSLGPH